MLLLLAACSGDVSVTTDSSTTDVGGGSTTTTTDAASLATTSTLGASTTTSVTTVATSTTTQPAFGWSTAPVESAPGSGVGANLTDIRIGDHAGYVRVVFDMTGAGNPWYVVAYRPGPFYLIGHSGSPDETSDEVISVEGSSFLHVSLDASIVDFTVDPYVLTYTEQVLEPGIEPIVQIVLEGDFEGIGSWVIGLNAERPFHVQVLQDPLRLVVDIEK